jgi:hypothetical protein
MRRDVEATGSGGVKGGSAVATPDDVAVVAYDVVKAPYDVAAYAGAKGGGGGTMGPIHGARARRHENGAGSGDVAKNDVARDPDVAGANPNDVRNDVEKNAALGFWASESPNDVANGSRNPNSSHHAHWRGRHEREKQLHDVPNPLPGPRRRRSWRKAKQLEAACGATQAQRQSVAGEAATQKEAQPNDVLSKSPQAAPSQATSCAWATATAREIDDVS